MTEKLFYQNSHMQTFHAKVVECIPDGEQYHVILDRTVFFPEGGGQYADTGWLEMRPQFPAEPETVTDESFTSADEISSNMGGQDISEKIRVVDVQESDEKIRHITNIPVPVGCLVSGTIDWPERFMKMQQHTGEHIVSGLVHRIFGYDNVGFHLGSEDCTMDFNGEITREELREIEYKANEAVVKNLEIQVSYPTKEELLALDYRSKIGIEGQVRIVTVPGYDVCACCAPHVDRTGEIGMVKLTNVQRYKGGVRVTMLCGFRALADYGKKSVSVKQICAALCAKEDETAQAVDYLKEECGQLKLRLAQQQKEMLKYKARETDGQGDAACLFEPELEGESPRLLMNLVLERGHALCAVFCGSTEEGYRYVIGSKSLDMRKLSKEMNTAFSGRGGGKPEMAQGALKGAEEEIKIWLGEKVRRWKDELYSEEK